MLFLFAAASLIFTGAGFILYLFFAYVMFRIGDKFLCGRYFDYLIPVYNLVLLCDCAGIPRITAAGLVLPSIAWLFHFFFDAASLSGGAFYAVCALFLFCWVYLWGSVARRLGKSFVVWGFLSLVFGGIPVLFLAFDSSLPRERRAGRPSLSFYKKNIEK